MLRTADPRGNDRLLFLRKFLRHGNRIAAVAPSSPELSGAMSEQVSGSRPQTIVELGAGTGAVTEAALERKHPGSRLVAVELDPEFAAILRARCPAAEVVEADVRDLDAALAPLALGVIDLVISCLPVPSLPRGTNEALFAWLARRAGEACFSQLTLVPWLFQATYERMFEEVRFHLVWRNLPPGGVYHCRRLRPSYADHLPGKARRRPRVASR